MAEHVPVIKLYMKANCPLCEDAKQLLDLLLSKDIRAHYEEIDIYSKDEWLEKYQLMIPVVEIEGEIVAYGRVDSIELKKRLMQYSLQL